MRLTTIYNMSKWAISSGGLRLLQMVSERDIRRCGSVDAVPPRRVNCEIPHWFKRETKNSL